MASPVVPNNQKTRQDTKPPRGANKGIPGGKSEYAGKERRPDPKGSRD